MLLVPLCCLINVLERGRDRGRQRERDYSRAALQVTDKTGTSGICLATRRDPVSPLSHEVHGTGRMRWWGCL